MSKPIDPDEIWKALADSHRRRLIEQLGRRAMTTGQLVDTLPRLSRTAVMKHLDVLEAARLIRVRREGRVRWNELDAGPLKQVCESWLQKRTGAWERSLQSLKQLAEERHNASN